MGYSDKKEDISDIFEHTEEVSVQVEEIPTVAPDLAAVKASRADQSDNFSGRMLQAAFDLFGIRYTGTGLFGSALAMDKNIAKQFFVANGIPDTGWNQDEKENREDDVTKLPLTLPCVVKPCCGGSSIGVTIVRDAAEFKKALDEAFHWEDELVIEEYVKGREFSVGVIEGKALPVIEIAPIQGFYDYKNKYKAGSAVETCPADLPEEVYKTDA